MLFAPADERRAWASAEIVCNLRKLRAGLCANAHSASIHCYGDRRTDRHVTIALDTLNTMDPADFERALADVFEHSPWIARAAAAERPFATIADLHAAMLRAVAEAGEAAGLALLRAHPELAAPTKLTAASAAEQAGLGLDALAQADAARMAALNRTYRERFGFPFIIAVRGQKDRTAIEAALQARLAHTPVEEERIALAEVGRIARFRLDDLVAAPKLGWLSVHVLDTARGVAAEGLELTLSRIAGEVAHDLGRWRTNGDGRVDERLLAGDAMQPGTYQVTFHVAAWRGTAAGFYDSIPIRFRIDDPDQDYHIPLLLAPFGYSTYRGT
jgi:2-oxo-4-hydroxy-4-carboxy-5-ureidoimidazoline decarboxylase